MTVTKTYKQLHAWMHPDHFSVFYGRSKDPHDLIHNGFLALTQAAATLKTKLKSGESVVGITGKLPVPKEQKEYFLRPTVASYTSVWSSEEHQASTYVTPVKKPAHILPETPLIAWKANKWHNLPNCPSLHFGCAAIVPRSDEHAATRVLVGAGTSGRSALSRVGL